MTSSVHQCPNCLSDLVLRADKDDFYCEYCRSGFGESELDATYIAHTIIDGFADDAPSEEMEVTEPLLLAETAKQPGDHDLPDAGVPDNVPDDVIPASTDDVPIPGIRRSSVPVTETTPAGDEPDIILHMDVTAEPDPWETLLPSFAHYRCPVCGNRITTVSAARTPPSCVFCRVPLLMESGAVTGSWKPEGVVPFAFDIAEARKRFLAWIDEHSFVDNSFYGETSLDNLQGLYVPCWTVDGRAQGKIRTTGDNRRVSSEGSIERIETTRYNIHRDGTINFDSLVLNATGCILETFDALCPFHAGTMQSVSARLLRDHPVMYATVEKEAVKGLVSDFITPLGQTLLLETITGYDRIGSDYFSLSVQEENWRGVLMPVWLLTFSSRGKTFFFAMNGQTGKITGNVPVSFKKIGGVFRVTWTAASVIMTFLL